MVWRVWSSYHCTRKILVFCLSAAARQRPIYQSATATADDTNCYLFWRVATRIRCVSTGARSGGDDNRFCWTGTRVRWPGFVALLAAVEALSSSRWPKPGPQCSGCASRLHVLPNVPRNGCDFQGILQALRVVRGSAG